MPDIDLPDTVEGVPDTERSGRVSAAAGVARLAQDGEGSAGMGAEPADAGAPDALTEPLPEPDAGAPMELQDSAADSPPVTPDPEPDASTEPPPEPTPVLECTTYRIYGTDICRGTCIGTCAPHPNRPGTGTCNGHVVSHCDGSCDGWCDGQCEVCDPSVAGI
jgi:hypothetical protein